MGESEEKNIDYYLDWLFCIWSYAFWKALDSRTGGFVPQFPGMRAA